MPDCLAPAVKPDGVVVLAHSADRGGCGPRTAGLLRRLAETAPVVVCRPACPGPAARDVPPADPACVVREVLTAFRDFSRHHYRAFGVEQTFTHLKGVTDE